MGVDIARGLAILGMYIAHVGHSVDGVDSPAWFVVADGRPSALFAILAGLSIALFTGGQHPPHGPGLVRGWLRVASRAVVIFVIGVLLMLLGTPVAVILPSYAVTFLLVAVFLAVRPGLVALAAGAAAVIGPTVLAALTVPAAGGTSAVERVLGTDGNFALDLVLTGYYPALVWIAYMLLGLFLGRLDLRAPRVQALVGAGGLALIVLGHGVSDVLLSALSPTDPVTYQLIRADPHSDSTFELLGNAGVGMVTLALVLALTTWPATARVARVALSPVAATGTMALSAYSGHIVVIAVLGDGVVWETQSNAVLVWFVLVTLAACTLWVRLVGRGPMEWLMRRVTVGAEPLAAGPPPRRT